MPVFSGLALAACLAVSSPARAASPLVVSDPPAVERLRAENRAGRLAAALAAAGADAARLEIGDAASGVEAVELSLAHGGYGPVATRIVMTGGMSGYSESSPLDSDYLIARHLAKRNARAKLWSIGREAAMKVFKAFDASYDELYMLMALGYALDLSAKSQWYFSALPPARAAAALADEARRFPRKGGAAGFRRAHLKTLAALEAIAEDGRYYVVDHNMRGPNWKPGPHGVVAKEDFEKHYGPGSSSTLAGIQRELDGELVTSCLAEAVDFVESKLGLRFDETKASYVR